MTKSEAARILATGKPAKLRHQAALTINALRKVHRGGRPRKIQHTDSNSCRCRECELARKRRKLETGIDGRKLRYMKAPAR